MSVLVKGMEMPLVGIRQCIISFADNRLLVTDVCGKIMFEGEYVEVPTPHGRLIDADNISSDAMCSHCVEEYCRNNCKCFIENVQTILSNELITPTIIEAEVSEE